MLSFDYKDAVLWSREKTLLSDNTLSGSVCDLSALPSRGQLEKFSPLILPVKQNESLTLGVGHASRSDLVNGGQAAQWT